MVAYLLALTFSVVAHTEQMESRSGEALCVRDLVSRGESYGYARGLCKGVSLSQAICIQGFLDEGESFGYARGMCANQE